MKFTRAAIRTSKETPADADSINAKLLTQGGFIHKEMAGVYTFLPLGKRVIKKIEQIVREEMDAVHGQEVGMPAITPLENWKQTGRENVDIAYKPTENTVLGWSHEEIVTPLAKQHIRSWKDLPLSLYQIQTKFRNEPRAKSGVLRGREFTMKDMYSFHATQEDLEQYYQQVLEAYLRVYTRCGLNAYPIEASGGVFTKKISHEFAVITPAGEDHVIFEEGSDGELMNPQNAEIAVGNPPALAFDAEKELEEREVQRPKGIAGTAKQYQIEEGHILKTVVLKISPTPSLQKRGIKAVASSAQEKNQYTESSPFEKGGSRGISSPMQESLQKKERSGFLLGISIRGDLEVNMDKVMSYFQTEDIRPATKEELKNAGLAQGFISPIKNDKIQFYADESVKAMTNFSTGANQMDHDYFNANIDRDCQFEDIADFVLVKEGFTSKETGNVLKAEKCVEVGNIFDLSTKFSEAFGVTFTDQEGKKKTPVMGCYGIGISRLLGTVVEAFHDNNGMIFPKSIAPYHVEIIPIGKPRTPEFDAAFAKAEELEASLQSKGIEVLLDDREERPGAKFADADLIGIPLRIVISPRTMEKNSVEWKERNAQQAKEVLLEDVEEKVVEWMESSPLS